MPWFDIKAKAASDTQAASAEIFVYGDIGENWWSESITANDFIGQINALDVDNITIRVNSLGGSVPDGIAIYNAIRRHKASVTVAIDGMAMSIASLIAMAGDEVQMAENAILMIHAPWTYADGNSAQLREVADALDKWAAAMATSYAAKTGKPEADMLALLTDGKDHYYTAAEALAEGFIDQVGPALAISAKADMAAVRASFRQASPATPAAAAAQPPKEQTMPNPNDPAAQSTAAPATPAAAAGNSDAAAVQAALAADATRRADIRAAFSRHPGEAFAKLSRECEDDLNCTVAQAKDKLLAALGNGATPAAGGVILTLEDERDKFNAGARVAILARAGLQKDDTSNSFRGMSLIEMARASLRFSGINAYGMDKMSLVAAAFTHTTSDFTSLLADAASKSMLKGYEEAAETFQQWTTAGVLPDFKAARRVDLNTFPALDVVPEGGEYKEATFGDRGETIQLATYGKLFSINRQAIINDDLSAFTKIPRNMGRSAIRTVGNLVYAILTGNPVMSDGKALFHADHNNLLDAATPNTSSVDAMRTAMRKQVDGTGNVLNVAMAYLLCPVALEGIARTVATSEYEVGASTRNNTTPNYVRGTFEVISDARLDAYSSSKWFGSANQAQFDTIEVAYLDGVQTPTLEQQEGWTVDGVQFKVRLDAGVKALDFRTLARNG